MCVAVSPPSAPTCVDALTCGAPPAETERVRVFAFVPLHERCALLLALRLHFAPALLLASLPSLGVSLVSGHARGGWGQAMDSREGVSLLRPLVPHVFAGAGPHSSFVAVPSPSLTVSALTVKVFASRSSAAGLVCGCGSGTHRRPGHAWTPSWAANASARPWLHQLWAATRRAPRVLWACRPCCSSCVEALGRSPLRRAYF